MDIKDISLSPKQVIYSKNIDNFTSIKKINQIKDSPCGYYKK